MGIMTQLLDALLPDPADGAGPALPPPAGLASGSRRRVPPAETLDQGLRPHGNPDAILAAVAHGAPARTVLFDPVKPHGLETALRIYAPEMGMAVIDWDTRGMKPWARLIILEPPEDKGAPR